MDRFELAREFKKTVMKDRVRKIDNVGALQQICCELLNSQFQLRERLRQSDDGRNQKNESFDSAYL